LQEYEAAKGGLDIGAQDHFRARLGKTYRRAKKKLPLKSRPVPLICATYTLSGNTRYYGLNRTVV
jgi:hypothetical protein